MRPQLMSVMWSRPSRPFEVDERAEIGDVLDRALADVAGHHLGEQLGAFVVAFLLDQFAAGEDDVLAFLVDLDDLEFVGVADELRRDSSAG